MVKFYIRMAIAILVKWKILFLMESEWLNIKRKKIHLLEFLSKGLNMDMVLNKDNKILLNYLYKEMKHLPSKKYMIIRIIKKKEKSITLIF